MQLTYWHYGVTKNWDYTYHDRMLDSNTFCYGKPRSQKTADIGHAYLARAIEMGRSIILYAPNQNSEYRDMVEVAQEDGYPILQIDANEPITDEQWSIINELPWQPAMICIQNEDFKTLAQYNNANRIISRLCSIDQAEFDDIVHVVIDGLCGNMLIQSAWLENKSVKFCMICTDAVASIRWRYDTADILCETFKKSEDQDLRVAVNTFAYDWEKDLDYALRRFFKPIETIICTGVNNVRPQDHKDFISHCFFAQKSTKGLGGRFCIEEHPQNEHMSKAKPLSGNNANVKPVEIEDDIENSDYGQIANRLIVPNMWIIEVNGRVHVLNTRGAYSPVIFREANDAKKWIEMHLEKNDIEVLGREDGTEVFIYSVQATFDNPLKTVDEDMFSPFSYFNFKHFVQNPKFSFEQLRDGDLQTEIMLFRIKPEDVSHIRMNYLINVLEIAEAEGAMPELCNDFYEQFQSFDVSQEDAYEFLRTWKPASMRKVEEEEADAPFEVPEEYRWKPYVKAEAANADTDDLTFDPVKALPKSGVLFLGGHQNMVKKLRQIFPDWEYISDDLFKRGTLGNITTIFFWTAHSSHSMMEFINARKGEDLSYTFVTATNINRLISEMAEKFLANQMNRSEEE